jgi:hypothetical protein
LSTLGENTLCPTANFFVLIMLPLYRFRTISDKEGMIVAGKAANVNRKPLIFDPVAVGATAYRKDTAKGSAGQIVVGIEGLADSSTLQSSFMLGSRQSSRVTQLKLVPSQNP